MSGATLTTNDPTYNGTTFMQTMTFEAPGKVGSREIDILTEHALRLFKGSLVLNGLTEHVWPPDRVEAAPTDDFKGGLFIIETRASKPSGPILIQ